MSDHAKLISYDFIVYSSSLEVSDLFSFAMCHFLSRFCSGIGTVKSHKPMTCCCNLFRERNDASSSARHNRGTDAYHMVSHDGKVASCGLKLDILPGQVVLSAFRSRRRACRLTQTQLQVKHRS